MILKTKTETLSPKPHNTFKTTGKNTSIVATDARDSTQKQDLFFFLKRHALPIMTNSQYVCGVGSFRSSSNLITVDTT